MTMIERTHGRAHELEAAIDEIKASRPTALKVLLLADDPETDARRLSEAVDLDPILTAHVMRLANSAAYGMSQRVASTQHAVSLVGFDSIRAVSALLASGLRNHRVPAPDGFWEHSAATAAACSVVSSRFGVPKGQAFSLGLLHDLGAALLHSVDPEAYRPLVSNLSDTASQCGLELVEFGMSHEQAAARILGQWNFPTEMVDAIATHHDTSAAITPHAQVLIAGDALAHLVLEPAGFGSVDPDHLESVGISPDAIPGLAALTSDYAAEVFAALPN